MTRAALLSAGAVAAAILSLFAAAPAPAEPAVRAPAPVVASREGPGLATAIFAGGCFWGVEGVFSHVRGVVSAVPGYHGGSAANAKYDLVGTGTTSHAEAVRVRYDPAKVRYDQLLQVFFSVVADPTLVDRQGPDRGPQYRSALVPVTAEQKKVAAAYLAQLGRSGLWKAPIATRIEPYKGFYPAEAYHQNYMARHPDAAYIVRNDAPKVAALKAFYPGLWRAGFLRD